MAEDEKNMPVACQPCPVQNICECDRLFLNCPHGKELIDYRNILKSQNN